MQTEMRKQVYDDFRINSREFMGNDRVPVELRDNLPNNRFTVENNEAWSQRVRREMIRYGRYATLMELQMCARHYNKGLIVE